MAIVGGLDLHRKQVTFDVVDTATGAYERGRIAPADRESFRRWLADFQSRPMDLAVEGCTGWRFVVEECQAAGARAHLAEPADVAVLLDAGPVVLGEAVQRARLHGLARAQDPQV